MDIIKMARDIGKEIQQQEEFIKFQMAKEKSDKDEALQNMISEFNLKRIAINNEATKENRNDEKLQQLNSELREVYSSIMSNENMTAYNDAQKDINKLTQRIVAIITQSAEGADPETADYSESCGGSCGSCAGCG